MASFETDSTVVSRVLPSPNHGERRGGARPDMIILHYTGTANAGVALDVFASAESQLSAHYVISEDGLVTQCVAEARRAWHAGVSIWAGETDINSYSIGIEVANPGHEFGYPDFGGAQIASVIALCRDIAERHDIAPWRILGHSDVAPLRKRDPGEKFPWDQLYRHGIGHWVEPASVSEGGGGFRPGDLHPAIGRLQAALAAYGYGIAASGIYDALTEQVVTAFQRHFRPACVDGIADASTIATLDHLRAALAESERASAPRRYAGGLG